MNAKFNLLLDDEEFFNEESFFIAGQKTYNSIKKRTLSNLIELIDKKIIDGNALQDMWFPEEFMNNEKFIFISHSHADEKLAIKLAGYLNQTFGIYSFIDSCVWHNGDDLKKQLNDCDYNGYNICHSCGCDGFSYNLSCVHMMLSSALAKMIDKCECIFFLNTPSSINLNKKTESPWIYYELNIADLVQKRKKVESLLLEYRYPFQVIEFTPKLEGMIDVNADVLRKWEQAYDLYGGDPYMVLYRICGGD